MSSFRWSKKWRCTCEPLPSGTDFAVLYRGKRIARLHRQVIPGGHGRRGQHSSRWFVDSLVIRPGQSVAVGDFVGMVGGVPAKLRAIRRAVEVAHAVSFLGACQEDPARTLTINDNLIEPTDRNGGAKRRRKPLVVGIDRRHGGFAQ